MGVLRQYNRDYCREADGNQNIPEILLLASTFQERRVRQLTLTTYSYYMLGMLTFCETTHTHT